MAFEPAVASTELPSKRMRKLAGFSVRTWPDSLMANGGLDRCPELISKLADMESLKREGFEILEAGFANCVCALELDGQRLVVKRYTDLVFLRIAREAIGAVDILAGEEGIGPRVLFSDATGLVEERLPGRTLTEAEMHCNDFSLLDRVAKPLARLHQLPVPEVCSGDPMLWRTTCSMLDVARMRPELWPPNGGVPDAEAILVEIDWARFALAKVGPSVVLGHNDCKPSNVIVCDDVCQPARLIDFELGGPNYRGFDLMKLFRTAAGPSVPCMLHFLRSYSEAAHLDTSEDTMNALLKETLCFEPLTWLEALVFFLAMPQFKPDETARWHMLSIDRWEKYQRTKHLLS